MSPIEMSKVENSLRSLLAFHQARGRQDAPAMLALLSPDCSLEAPGPAPDGALHPGPPAVVAFWLAFCPPGAELQIEEAYSLGFRGLLRWKLQRPDGSSLRGVEIVQLKNGLIWKVWVYVKGDLNRTP